MILSGMLKGSSPFCEQPVSKVLTALASGKNSCNWGLSESGSK